MKSVLKATTKLLFCKLCDRMSVEYLIKSNPLNPVPRPELNPALDGIRDHLGSVIVFVNPKSGGKKGEIVLAILKNYLPKENVFDLTKRGPKEGLEMHKEKKDLKIIACGGDGTAGWVLSAMDEIDFGGDPPAIAMIPLGTGNDLARSFGWGGGYIVDEEPMKDFLDKVINGSVIKMDRWSIATTRRSESNRKEADKSTRDKSTLPYSSLNNYLSIGADSKIALDFHRARDKNPEHFTSQNLNKVEYAKVSS
jgi:diacylglycerol kinase (ATP)